MTVEYMQHGTLNVTPVLVQNGQLPYTDTAIIRHRTDNAEFGMEINRKDHTLKPQWANMLFMIPKDSEIIQGV